MSSKPCYCINPDCQQPDYSGNVEANFCHICGSSLVINHSYRVKQLLSDDSGFGIIYEVVEGYKTKILKVLKPEHNSNSKVIDLFKQEYQVLCNLTQQNIRGIPQVNPNDYFEYQAKTGLVLQCLMMEKVEGIDLIQWLKNNDKISQNQAIKWLREIVKILANIHKQNYFHRDIKPQNIMQRNNGELVLIDFGTAREETITYYQKIPGQGITGVFSPGYTPIEQQNGQAVVQSDFFALGRTFVHLLTGKYPLDTKIYDPIHDQLNWRGHTENVNPIFLDLIDNLIARLPKDRPENTDIILHKLDQVENLINQGLTPINNNQITSLPTIPISGLDNVSNKNISKILIFSGIIILSILGIKYIIPYPNVSSDSNVSSDQNVPSENSSSSDVKLDDSLPLPVGWIRIGAVNNKSGTVSVGETLIGTTQPVTITPPVIPAIGDKIYITEGVHLRENFPQPPNYKLAEIKAAFPPRSQVIILRIESFVDHTVSSNYTVVWAEVGFPK
jgi:serine/threonine protein kinase